MLTAEAFTQKLEVSTIHISGNDRTKDFVILREVPISEGDSILSEDLEAIKKDIVRNITNTSLTNFIDVKFDTISAGQIACNIKIHERWYIWPNIIFSLADPNFSTWIQDKNPERLNYGFSISDFNFRGRREKLTVNFQNGWTRKVGINYQIPGLNKKRTLGGGFEFYYSNNREINHQLLFNPEEYIYNKRDFVKATRFIKEEIVARAKLEYRRKFLNTHRWIAGIETIIIDDTVRNANPDYLPNGKTRSQYFYLSYGFKREKRDNKAYPLTGYLIDGSVDHRGLGILNKNDVFLTEALITVNFHHQIKGRWFFGHGYKGKLTPIGAPPYYFQRGLGYSNNFVRGYELYVIDGQHYILHKNNIKYQLIRKQTIDLKTLFRKFDKFHYSVFLNAFSDAGYVIDNLNGSSNPLANTWQYSCGLGLDFVTYYDLVVRFEGSINKLGNPGFYVNFRCPI
ncbi:MAG: POTRA domain-containing protein [Flavobacteriales bacterium]